MMTMTTECVIQTNLNTNDFSFKVDNFKHNELMGKKPKIFNYFGS